MGKVRHGGRAKAILNPDPPRHVCANNCASPTRPCFAEAPTARRLRGPPAAGPASTAHRRHPSGSANGRTGTAAGLAATDLSSGRADRQGWLAARWTARASRSKARGPGLLCLTAPCLLHVQLLCDLHSESLSRVRAPLGLWGSAPRPPGGTAVFVLRAPPSARSTERDDVSLPGQ